MFRACTFTFAGIASHDFGLYCCDIGSDKHSDNSFGNKAEIIEERISQRVSPLHYGVNYHNEPLSFEMIFGAKKPLDRYDLQAIARWLTGHQQYQWLSIHQSDMDEVMYRCLIRELTPISVGWFPVAFRAKVVCDCPYAYSLPFKKTCEVSSGIPTDFLIKNPGTARQLVRPKVVINVASGCTTFSIKNKNNGNKTTSFSDLEGGIMRFEMDNENCVITETAQKISNPYKYFNFNFFELVEGDNNLEIRGDGSVTFSGRYLHNVGA